MFGAILPYKKTLILMGVILMRFSYILPVALIISMLSGCVDKISEGLGLFNKEKTSSVSILTAPQIMFDEIIYALDNKGREHLKSLFSQNALAQSPDIDKQIDEIFEFYKGKSVYDGGVDSGGGSSHIENGKYVYLFIIPSIRNFETDKAAYWLSFNVVVVDKDNPNDVGLWGIWLRSMSGNEIDYECHVGSIYKDRA